MERRKERKERAANVLVAFYRWKKGRISWADYSGFYSKWHQCRVLNQDLKYVFDGDDTTGMLRDISADVKSLLSMQNAATQNKPPARSAAQSNQFDDELSPLLASLQNLRALASSLAGYGVTSLEELLAMEEKQAIEILEKLKWSPVQIQKVLHPK